MSRYRTPWRDFENSSAQNAGSCTNLPSRRHGNNRVPHRGRNAAEVRPRLLDLDVVENTGNERHTQWKTKHNKRELRRGALDGEHQAAQSRGMSGELQHPEHAQDPKQHQRAQTRHRDMKSISQQDANVERKNRGQVDDAHEVSHEFENVWGTEQPP